MKNYSLFALLAAFWGGSFIAIKYVIAGMPPIVGAAVRVGIALCCLLVLFAAMRKSIALPRSLWWKVWLTGLFAQGFPFALLFWGERSISAGLAGILNGTVPIWTLAIGLTCFPHQEERSWRKVIGLALGVVGIAILFSPTVRFGGSQQELLGTAAVLGMAVSYAIGTTLNRHLLAGTHKVDFYANLIHQHIASLLFLALAAFWIEGSPTAMFRDINLPAIVASCYLGICSTALAWIAFYHLIREWGAVRASSVTYVVPAVAMLFDRLFFAKHPSVYEGIGFAIILAGILLIQRRTVVRFRLETP